VRKEVRVVDGAFGLVYGKPCWNVRQGYGSILKLDFGQPHLLIREPIQIQSDASEKIQKHFLRRLVMLRGDWTLTIFGCTWIVSSNGNKTAESGSSRPRIRRALADLNSQALIKVSGDLGKGRWLFTFDLGGVLETRRFDLTTEQWWLYESSGYSFSVRGAGEFSYSPNDLDPLKKKWLSIKAPLKGLPVQIKRPRRLGGTP
jgi:hypothetical protein